MKKELTQWAKDRIAAGKRLTKSDMAYQLPALHPAGLYPEVHKRDELVAIFNEYFGTNIK
jgi:hypothetical protein